MIVIIFEIITLFLSSMYVLYAPQFNPKKQHRSPEFKDPNSDPLGSSNHSAQVTLVTVALSSSESSNIEPRHRHDELARQPLALGWVWADENDRWRSGVPWCPRLEWNRG